MHPTHHTNCLIVGAGPAGVLLAYELVRRGIDVTLIELQSDFERAFRGEVMQPGSVDLLEDMGLDALLMSTNPVKITGIEIYHNKKIWLSMDIQSMPIRHPYALVFSQPKLLTLLTNEAKKYPRFHLLMSTPARGLLTEGGRIVGVKVQREHEEMMIQADLVVAADGRGSAFVRWAEMEPIRNETPFDVVWFKIHAPHSPPHKARMYFGGGRMAVLVPPREGLMQIGWIIHKGSFGDLKKRSIDELKGQIMPFCPEDVQQQIKTHLTDLKQIVLLSVVSSRLKQWWREDLLFIGDACHPMSPVGGQGINIAFRDAVVAARHLAEPLKKRISTVEALKAIQKEREGEVAAIQKLQAGPPKIFMSHGFFKDKILIPILPAIINATGLKRRIIKRMALGTTRVKAFSEDRAHF